MAFAGISGSPPVLVTTSVVSAAIVRFAWAGRVGAPFTSVTTTIKVLVALSGGVPLSVTRVVNVFVLGPCASDGLQVMTPDAEIAAAAGATSNVYVSVLGAESVSEAVFVTVSVVNSAIVRLLCGGKTGAVFAGVTTTRKLFVVLSGGEPLSVATVVMVLVVEAWAEEGVHVITPLPSIAPPAGEESN